MEERRLNLTAISLWALFFFFMSLPVILGVGRFCHHNYDLGIFSQALNDLSLSNWNPWITGRQVHIFNDHVHPILFTLALPAKIFRPDYVAVFGELFYITAAFFLLYMAERKKLLPKNSLLLFGGLFLFSRGLVRGATFPIHPTTWSVLPWVMLCLAIHFENRFWTIASFGFLMLFREEYPFVAFTLGPFLFWQDKKKEGIWILAIGIAWALVAFVLRPAIMGGTENYGGGVIGKVLSNPGMLWKWYFSEFTLSRRILEYFIPLLPLVWFLKKENRAPNWAILSATVSMLALRFLSGKWTFHYAAPLIVPLTLCFLPKPGQAQFPKKVIGLCLVLAVALNIGTMKKSLAFIFAGDSGRCAKIDARIDSINKGRKFLLENREGKALVEGNLLASLAERGEVYQTGGAYSAREDNSYFKYVFVEKPPYGNPYDITHERIAEWIDKWSQDPAVTVHINDDHVFLGEGEFLDHE